MRLVGEPFVGKLPSTRTGTHFTNFEALWEAWICVSIVFITVVVEYVIVAAIVVVVVVLMVV